MLLPQIQGVWRRFLLPASIPNENSAPSITSIAIISNTSSPFHSPSDHRLRETTRDIFLPVASYFHNMNVVKCMTSKLPLGEEYPIPLFSLTFSSNLHYTWIYKHPLSSWGSLFWSSGFSWNMPSSSWLEIRTSVCFNCDCQLLTNPALTTVLCSWQP